MDRVQVALVGALALNGCASSLAALDATERQQHLRIEQLDAQIKTDEARAERARVTADYEACRAQRESIVASAMTKIAACKEQEAQESECLAKNEGSTARKGIGGCVLGILATAMTAGGGMPLALAGCGAGLAVGHATATDCKPGNCDLNPEMAMRASLAEHNASMFPLCGGAVGVTVRQTVTGLDIDQVDPTGPASGAGLRPRDVLLALNGQRLSTMEDAGQAMLDLQAPGTTVVLLVGRDGRPFQAQLTLVPRRSGQLGL